MMLSVELLVGLTVVETSVESLDVRFQNLKETMVKFFDLRFQNLKETMVKFFLENENKLCGEQTTLKAGAVESWCCGKLERTGAAAAHEIDENLNHMS